MYLGRSFGAITLIIAYGVLLSQYTGRKYTAPNQYDSVQDVVDNLRHIDVGAQNSRYKSPLRCKSWIVQLCNTLIMMRWTRTGRV